MKNINAKIKKKKKRAKNFEMSFETKRILKVRAGEAKKKKSL